MKIIGMDQTSKNSWRDDFPALHHAVSGKPLAFLDSAASAQKPQSVIDAMNDVLIGHYANIHRGLYRNSQITTEKFEAVRGKVAGFIGATSSNEIVFTRSTTESINLVAHSWGARNLKAEDEIILSEMEHHANIVPWVMLAQEIGFNIKVIPVLDDGTLDLDAFEQLLTHKTKFIGITAVSNALGTINDVNKVTAIARDFYPEMKILVDGTQAVVHGDVNVGALDADFFVFTGHKLYGPSGVGVLWAREEILAQMPPYQGGGDMIETVSFTDISFKPAPAKFEAGTPAIVEVIGLGAAIDYLNDIGMDNIKAYESALSEKLEYDLSLIDGINLIGQASDKIGVYSFVCDWGHPSDIGVILDHCGVAVRTGHHCCQPLMRRFGIDATVRASIGLYSNEDDIAQLCEGLEKARSMLA